MQLQKNTDYILIKRACYYDGGRMNQQGGNLLVTKNKVILNVVQTNNIVEAALGKENPNYQYKEDNLVNSIHNIKVSTQEVKDSFKETKEFYRQRKETVKCYEILKKLAAEAKDISDFEMKASLLSQGNPKSIEFNVEDIDEVKSGFFKIWMFGLVISLNNKVKWKIQTHKVGAIRKMINK
jgi:hypothetical protein